MKNKTLASGLIISPLIFVSGFFLNPQSNLAGILFSLGALGIVVFIFFTVKKLLSGQIKESSILPPKIRNNKIALYSLMIIILIETSIILISTDLYNDVRIRLEGTASTTEAYRVFKNEYESANRSLFSENERLIKENEKIQEDMAKVLQANKNLGSTIKKYCPAGLLETATTQR